MYGVDSWRVKIVFVFEFEFHYKFRQKCENVNIRMGKDCRCDQREIERLYSYYYGERRRFLISL